jgi:hypothetical protein
MAGSFLLVMAGEFHQFEHIYEIPKADFEILKKYKTPLICR